MNKTCKQCLAIVYIWKKKNEELKNVKYDYV